MRNTKTQIIFLLFWAFLQISCNRFFQVYFVNLEKQTVELEVLTPADTIFPERFKRIGLASTNSILCKTPKDSLLHFYPYQSFIEELQEKINNVGRFEIIELTHSISEPKTSIDWTKIQKRCIIDSLDALCLIEKFQSKITVDIVDKKYWYSDFLRYQIYEIPPSQENYDSVHFSLNFSILILDPIYQKVYQKVFSRNRNSGSYLIVKKYNLMKEILELRTISSKAGKWSGNRLAEYLSPTWKTTERSLYSDGNSLFRRSYELAQNGNWEEANQIWNDLAGAKERNKVKATFNRCVYKEIYGLFDEVSESLYQLNKLGFPDDAILSYASTIKTRMGQIKIIEKQMKGSGE